MDPNFDARRTYIDCMKSNEAFYIEDKTDQKKIILPRRSVPMSINIEKSKSYQKRLALKLK